MSLSGILRRSAALGIVFITAVCFAEEPEVHTWFLDKYPRWGTCDQAIKRVRTDFERVTGIRASSAECYDVTRMPHYLPGSFPPPFQLTVRYLADERLPIVTTKTAIDGYHPIETWGTIVQSGYPDDESCMQDLFGSQFPLYRPDWKKLFELPGAPIINFTGPMRDRSDSQWAIFPPPWESVLDPKGPMSEVKRFHHFTGVLPAAAYCSYTDEPMNDSHPWIMRIESFLREPHDDENIRPFQYFEYIFDQGSQKALRRRVRAIEKAYGLGSVGRAYVGRDFLMMRTYISILYYGRSPIQFQER